MLISKVANVDFFSIMASGFVLVQQQIEKLRVHFVGQGLWRLDASNATEKKLSFFRRQEILLIEGF